MIARIINRGVVQKSVERLRFCFIKLTISAARTANSITTNSISANNTNEVSAKPKGVHVYTTVVKGIPGGQIAF